MASVHAEAAALAAAEAHLGFCEPQERRKPGSDAGPPKRWSFLFFVLF